MAMQHHPKPFFSFIQLLSCLESFFMENGSCVLCSGSLLCFPLLFALSRHTYQKTAQIYGKFTDSDAQTGQVCLMMNVMADSVF